MPLSSHISFVWRKENGVAIIEIRRDEKPHVKMRNGVDCGKESFTFGFATRWNGPHAIQLRF